MDRTYGIWFGTFALFLLGVQAPVQSQDPSNAICPAGCAIFDRICLNEVTGDIVSQSLASSGVRIPARSQGPSNPVCALGYVAFEGICLNEATGDIVGQLPATLSPSASSKP